MRADREHGNGASFDMPRKAPRHRESQDFATIDDLLDDEPLGPPPPYSTVPPKVSSRTTVTAPVVPITLPSSTTVSEGNERIMPDSEDDEDEIIDFTGGKQKRAEARGGSPSKRHENRYQMPPVSYTHLTLPTKRIV